jgi:alpha-tubulin suppressor-like RCC1 family protein
VGLFGEVQDGAEPVLLMENVAYVRAGMECIAALDRDQNVWWWGQYCGTYHTKECDSRDYEKSTEDEHNPAKILYTRPRKLLENCIYVTTGNTTGAAIGADGSLYTWGRNLLESAERLSQGMILCGRRRKYLMM